MRFLALEATPAVTPGTRCRAVAVLFVPTAPPLPAVVIYPTASHLHRNQMNHHQKCTVADCHELRTRFGRYCRSHKRRLAHFGHPRGRPLSRTGEDLAGHARRIEALLSANSDHAGLSRATRELQQQLEEAAERVRANRSLQPATPHWARLAAHGVTPLAILARVVAVVVIDRENPRLFPDQRAMEFAIARAVFGLAPNSGKPLGSRILEATGRRMIGDYIELIVNAVAALKASEEDARQRDADMQADMRPAPTSNL